MCRKRTLWFHNGPIGWPNTMILMIFKDTGLAAERTVA